MNSNEPNIIIAGDSISWTKSITKYPATIYKLTYYFRGVGSFDIEATANGNDYLVSINPTTSGAYSAGLYSWESKISKISGGEVYTIASGKTLVKASLTTQSIGYDPRTYNEKLLDAITSLLDNTASKADVLSFSIGGRSISKMDYSELLKLQSKLKWKVKNENYEPLCPHLKTR